jgi:hypothetical protein
MGDGEFLMMERADGRWRIGGSGEVAWINAATSPGRTIAAAIPPRFACYATIVVPEDDAAKIRSDAALVDIVTAHSRSQSWWLGYLETGVADIMFPDAPRVTVYSGWPYVLVEAGPEQAREWRRGAEITPWHSGLPELLFPADQSWLISTLWDDDWRCVGGTDDLLAALLRHPDLDARAVDLGDDATPPGHKMI